MLTKDEKEDSFFKEQSSEKLTFSERIRKNYSKSVLTLIAFTYINDGFMLLRFAAIRTIF